MPEGSAARHASSRDAMRRSFAASCTDIQRCVSARLRLNPALDLCVISCWGREMRESRPWADGDLQLALSVSAESSVTELSC